MGYLDNTTITVDAVLTKKGRQLLSQGRQNFTITKFALADDEVDYNLWNVAHPSGSNYYGVAIEEMPVLEPSADETQSMRYKLVSLPKDTVKIPVVSVFPVSITFKQGQFADIVPNTIYAGGTSTTLTLNSQYGYTAILHNSDVATLDVIDAAPTTAGGSIQSMENRIVYLENLIAADPGKFDDSMMSSAQEELRGLNMQVSAARAALTTRGSGMFLGDTDTARSVWAVGMKFRITARQVTATTNTTVTIIGNETGGSVSIPITNIAIALTSVS